jgi:hypothetical protein
VRRVVVVTLTLPDCGEPCGLSRPSPKDEGGWPNKFKKSNRTQIQPFMQAMLRPPAFLFFRSYSRGSNPIISMSMR